MVLGQNLTWLYVNKLGERLLIDIDTLTCKFRLYSGRDGEKTRDDFRQGQLRMEEVFTNQDCLMRYTHAMRLACNLSHSQILSDTKDITDGND